MELATQMALVIAVVARIRESWPRIEGRWVLLVALALAVVLVLVQSETWGTMPSRIQLIVRIVSVFLGAVGSASFAKYIVHKHAAAIANTRAAAPPNELPR